MGLVHDVGSSNLPSPAFDIDALTQVVHLECARLWPYSGVTEEGLALAEEAGEVCRAILKRFEGTRATKEYWSGQIRKEVGQVIIVAMSILALEGYSTQEVIIETVEHLKAMKPDDRRAED